MLPYVTLCYHILLDVATCYGFLPFVTRATSCFLDFELILFMLPYVTCIDPVLVLPMLTVATRNIFHNSQGNKTFLAYKVVLPGPSRFTGTRKHIYTKSCHFCGTGQPVAIGFLSNERDENVSFFSAWDKGEPPSDISTRA